MSSAHVYLRLRPGQTIDDIPSSVLEDAAQLVKANSIQGNKMNDIDIVYTMWANLKKTPGMDVGQVGFYKEKDVRKMKVAKRINDIINRLNKTKRTEEPGETSYLRINCTLFVLFTDLRAEREKRDRLEREDKKKVVRELKEKEKSEEKKKAEEAETRSYSSLFKVENMTLNSNDGNDSDEFM